MLLWFMSESVKSFIVSSLTFSYSIHFKFTFVYGVRECSNFILLHVAVHISQHLLLKRLSFLHCVFVPLMSSIRWLSYFIGIDFCFCARTIWFDDSSFVVYSGVKKPDSSSFVFLLKIALVIWGLFVLPYKF